MTPSVSPRPPVAERPDCAPALKTEIAVSQTCPIDIAGEINAGEINRRWKPRLSAGEMIMRATGFARSATGICVDRPQGLGALGKGLVHRPWLRRACGDEWVTALHARAWASGCSAGRCIQGDESGGVSMRNHRSGQRGRRPKRCVADISSARGQAIRDGLIAAPRQKRMGRGAGLAAASTAPPIQAGRTL